MAMNPIGAIVIGITATIAAVAGLIAIYDHFNMSTKEAE